jgi:hypothetical protein
LPGLPAFGTGAHDVGFGEIGWGDFVGGFEAEEGEGEAFADAVVVYGEDVGAAEPEDEEHLYCPTANAADLSEVFDDGFVGHATDAREGGYGAIEGFGGEVAEGEGFVVGEAGGAELLVGAVEKVLSGGVDADAGDRVEALEQAAVDGCGGLAVELLIDDAFDKGFKWGLRAGHAEGEGSGALDELTEFGVGGGELFACESCVVARWPWAGEWAGHGVHGIADGGIVTISVT